VRAHHRLVGDHRVLLVAARAELGRVAGHERDRLPALLLPADQRVGRALARVVALGVADLDAAQRAQLGLRVGDQLEDQLRAADALVLLGGARLALLHAVLLELVLDDLAVLRQVARDGVLDRAEEPEPDLLDLGVAGEPGAVLDALLPLLDRGRGLAHQGVTAPRVPEPLDRARVAAADAALEQLGDEQHAVAGRDLRVVADLDHRRLVAGDRVADQLFIALERDDRSGPARERPPAGRPGAGRDHPRHRRVPGRALEREDRSERRSGTQPAGGGLGRGRLCHRPCGLLLVLRHRWKPLRRRSHEYSIGRRSPRPALAQVFTATSETLWTS
jgi:hypothetical protein